MTRICSFVLAFFLAGCVATGPLYTPPPAAPSGYSTLVFMREAGAGGAAWPHHYYVDQTLLAKLAVRGYTYVYLKPGRREVHSGGTPEYRGLLFTVDIAPGGTYYYFEGRRFFPTITRRPGEIGVELPSGNDFARMLTREQAEEVLKEHSYQAPLKPVLE